MTDAIAPAIDAILGMVDDVGHPIDVADALRARLLIEGEAQLSARDAVHVAVMERRSIRLVMSIDRGFDGLPG